jgi:hypothetical protein
MVPRQPTEGRIGSTVRLHVLDLGRPHMASLLIAGGPAGVAVEISVPADVIEHPSGNILFDTGWFGHDAAQFASLAACYD